MTKVLFVCLNPTLWFINPSVIDAGEVDNTILPSLTNNYTFINIVCSLYI